ncbi:MAG: thiamine-phosphate kinase [Nitrospirota bacterium]
MKLSQTGELSLIELIRDRFREKSRGVIVGIGDDAAVIKPPDKNLLVTTDTMVEKFHFDLSFITPYQLGFKLVSVNVSDIYSMGGKPLFLLLNISAKKNTEMTFIDSFFDGLRDSMDRYGVNLIGGDLSSSYRDMTLSATVLGVAKRPIRRSGAKIGDKIYISGNIGDSACGLELLKKIRKPFPFSHPSPSMGKGKGGGEILRGLPWKAIEPLIRKHLLPIAREPKEFASYASAMIDVSDGLLIDLWRLCNESKVGARIYIKKIPLSSELKQAASHLGLSPLKLALSGGEDYELLFTASPKKKVKAIHIGEITESERVIVDATGREKPFTPEGYQHFV